MDEPSTSQITMMLLHSITGGSEYHKYARLLGLCSSKEMKVATRKSKSSCSRTKLVKALRNCWGDICESFDSREFILEKISSQNSLSERNIEACLSRFGDKIWTDGETLPFLTEINDDEYPRYLIYRDPRDRIRIRTYLYCLVLNLLFSKDSAQDHILGGSGLSAIEASQDQKHRTENLLPSASSKCVCEVSYKCRSIFEYQSSVECPLQSLVDQDLQDRIQRNFHGASHTSVLDIPFQNEVNTNYGLLNCSSRSDNAGEKPELPHDPSSSPQCGGGDLWTDLYENKKGYTRLQSAPKTMSTEIISLHFNDDSSTQQVRSLINAHSKHLETMEDGQRKATQSLPAGEESADDSDESDWILI